jgi:alkaline phosphatase D
MTDATHGHPATSTTRRTFLAGAAAGAAALATPARARARFAPFAEPFTLGVASGDPLPRSVVLWTRLAPRPTEGGGMPARDVPVRYEVAADEGFGRVVRRGWTVARPASGHAVHVDLRGLEPHAEYWYRFRAGAFESPVGRTVTAPPRGASPESLRFAFASCQDWQDGFWPAFTDLAAQELELVVHLGDYIYENAANPGALRPHEGPEPVTLQAYRDRYALYRTDPALQAAHARCPWVVVWDDHEVENDYADLLRDEGAPPDPVPFPERRANAYRAYYENMPLRRTSLPRGPEMRLYRRVTYGDLVEFSVLDTRQYRSDQPCENGLDPRETCPAQLAPEATMTGPEQERWLLEGLDRSRAQWNVIAQQTMLAQFDFNPAPDATLFNSDGWDGYVAARNRVLGFLLHREPSNPVVITGDIHSSWVHDLKADFDDPASVTVGTELVGPSISSSFPAAVIPAVQAAAAVSPHTRFFDGRYRGYVRNTLGRDRWQADFRVVESTATPESRAFTLASFEVRDGEPGARPVAGGT